MNIKTLLFLLFITISSNVVYPQTIKIVPRKVVYQRTNPEISDWKREFEITYPVITSRLKAGTRKNLEKTMSYWRIFKTPLREHLDNSWTTNLNYKILYNKNYILSIVFNWEGIGAYPDSSTEHLVIDLKTGKQIDTKTIFKNNSLPKLLAKIRKAIRNREDVTRKENSCFAETIDFQRESEISKEFFPIPEKIKYEDLSGFFLNEKGVTFIFDYNFAHVVEACEPEKEYFFSWSQLKPFIKREGLLEKFIS